MSDARITVKAIGEATRCVYYVNVHGENELRMLILVERSLKLRKWQLCYKKSRDFIQIHLAQHQLFAESKPDIKQKARK